MEFRDRTKEYEGRNLSREVLQAGCQKNGSVLIQAPLVPTELDSKECRMLGSKNGAWTNHYDAPEGIATLG